MKMGKNVIISPKASIYGEERIQIGNNVRIDDFCILSAGKKGIQIGNNVHIGCYSCLLGQERIQIGDYCGISMRVTVLSSSDDYSGDFLIGPVIPKNYLNVNSQPVIMENFSVLAAGVIVMPGVKFGVGSAAAALSFVNKSVGDFSMVGGVPAKHLFYRSKKMISVARTMEYELYERKD